MRIGIDASPLTTPFPCGTKSYAENLLKSLAVIDKKNEYIIFATKNVKIPDQKNFKLVKLPNFLPVFKRQFFIPYFVSREKIDVFHNLEPFGSIFLKHSKIITTVHDLNLNNTYPLFSKYFFNRIYCEFTRGFVFKNSWMFITNSHSVRKELEGYLRETNQVAIKTFHIGYDGKYFKKNQLKKRDGILCMGDFAVRKNIPMVISVYSRLPLQIKQSHKLRIVCSTKETKRKFVNIVKKYRIERFTKIYTAIDNTQLAWLYNNSLVFLYPSLYEGFGIPILEAFACGCPVITSNYGSMKEIAKKAALLVNPKSEKSITLAIANIYNSKATRDALIQKGLQRVKTFDWLDTAERTLKLYNQLHLKSQHLDSLY